MFVRRSISLSIFYSALVTRKCESILRYKIRCRKWIWRMYVGFMGFVATATATMSRFSIDSFIHISISIGVKYTTDVNGRQNEHEKKETNFVFVFIFVFCTHTQTARRRGKGENRLGIVRNYEFSASQSIQFLFLFFLLFLFTVISRSRCCRCCFSFDLHEKRISWEANATTIKSLFIIYFRVGRSAARVWNFLLIFILAHPPLSLALLPSGFIRRCRA